LFQVKHLKEIYLVTLNPRGHENVAAVERAWHLYDKHWRLDQEIG